MVGSTRVKFSPVLLVEDDPNDVWLLRRAFERVGVQNPLLVAQNGEEAIQILTSHRRIPCLLITDIKMPKVDGFDLLRWLQSQPQFASMPKVVISSSILEEDLAKSLQHGATAYFVKPSSHAALIKLIQRWAETFSLAVRED